MNPSQQDIVLQLSHPPVYNPVDINSIVNTSSAELPTTLPPLNATPIIMAPLQQPNATHQTYLLAQKKPTKGTPRPSRERAPWTPEEDNLLRLAVQLYGDKTEKWAKIAACVPGRTNKNCRKRWFHSLDPSLRKGAWTDEEDQLLREGVSKYPNQWSKIADMLEGRTDDQCAKRWRESLDPSIDRSEWTAQEDARLMEKYEEYGSQWQKIAFFFDGRPGLHCRNRWRKLQRMIQMKKEKEGAGITTSFFNTIAEDQAHRFQQQHHHNNHHHNTNSNSNNNHHGNDNSNNNNTNNNNSLIDSASHSHNTQQTQHQLSHQQNNQSQQSHHHHLASLLTTTQDPSILAQFPSTATIMDHDFDENEILKGYGSDVKPYGCDVAGCYAAFQASTGLFYHMKNTHPNLEGVEKPYRCAMLSCSKKYKNINGLQYHIRDAKGSSGHAALTGERPHRCTVMGCKKAYRTPNGLRYHQQHGHNIEQAHLEQPNQQLPQFRMKREKWSLEGV
jgi:hypothetical protein